MGKTKGGVNNNDNDVGISRMRFLRDGFVYTHNPNPNATFKGPSSSERHAGPCPFWAHIVVEPVTVPSPHESYTQPKSNIISTPPAQQFQSTNQNQNKTEQNPCPSSLGKSI